MEKRHSSANLKGGGGEQFKGLRAEKGTGWDITGMTVSGTASIRRIVRGGTMAIFGICERGEGNS